MTTLIVIEGGDKRGKETQSKMLASALKAEGNNVALAEVPIKGAITHKLIYWMLKNGIARKVPNLFQFIQFMNRFTFQVLNLPSLMKKHDFVILDRWALSSIIYGDATSVNKRFNRFLFSLMKVPDMTIIMTGEKTSNVVDDSYEADTTLQKSVDDGYRNWAVEHPVNCELVSNHGTREQVHSRIMCTLMHDRIVVGKWWGIVE